MSKALSLDLRTRVLVAIAEGMSCRWRALERQQGDARPKALGGDRRSGRIEAHGELILGLVEDNPDMTLEELRAAPATHGVWAGYGTLWRYFDRHGITRKKRLRMTANRIARTS